MSTPIVVPSKGRAWKSKTITLLQEAGVRPTVFIEPQEVKAYGGAYPDCDFFVLPESNQGIGYVRQQILEHARKQGWAAYWMLDDDITGLFRVEGGKCLRTDSRAVLVEAEAVLRKAGVAQGALEYQQFAWAAKKPLKLIGYCDVAVWIDVEKTRLVNYRRKLDLKEDRDFTLQILACGELTGRSTWHAFSAPKNGSNAGGLQEEYAKVGREAEASQRMVAAWPGICELHTKPDGRPDVKIHWERFKPT
jgi:hypothetical protein